MSFKEILIREEKKYLRYWPVALMYAIILALSFVTVSLSEHTHFMSQFMGWTLIIFGILKLEDIDSFAEGFRKYDIFAGRSALYAKAYPMLEVLMGVFYLIDLFTSPITILVLVLFSSTLLGLFRKLRIGEKIDCLCLGVRFKLPLSIVAVFESAIMVAMAVWMLSM